MLCYIAPLCKVKVSWAGSHLECWREEGRADPVNVSGVDLDANVAVVHLGGVERALSGADVALS